MQRKVLAIFETPTVFLLESTTPEIVSALGINPELELTILLRKDGVAYADKTKKVGSDRMTAGKAWESIRSLFKGDIYVVKEDVEQRGIPAGRIVSQLELIQRKDVARLIDKSNTIMVY
jgi:sulfur transfer complex TusBCD TusB component (DsrH family)